MSTTTEVSSQYAQQLIMGAELMAVGMLTVFSFLAILVMLMTLMSRVFASQSIITNQIESQSDANNLTSPLSGIDDPQLGDPELVAAITVAVQKYRAMKR